MQIVTALSTPCIVTVATCRWYTHGMIHGYSTDNSFTVRKKRTVIDHIIKSVAWRLYVSLIIDDSFLASSQKATRRRAAGLATTIQRFGRRIV